MKKTYLVLTAALLFGISSTAYSAPTVYIDLDGVAATAETALNIAIGDPFTANLYASDFVTPTGNNYGGLIAFGLNLGYDSTLVTAGAPQVASPWIPNQVTASPGSISLGGIYPAFPPLPGLDTVAAPLLLGSVSFSGSMEGVINLLLSDRATLEWGGVTSYLDNYAFDADILFQGATITAGNPGGPAVPVPGAVWLLGAGLTSLFGLRSRSKKTA